MTLEELERLREEAKTAVEAMAPMRDLEMVPEDLLEALDAAERKGRGEAHREFNEKAKKACTCADQVNSQLSKDNTRIATNLYDRRMIFIETELVEKKPRQKPKKLIASHCPFCGRKLEES